MRETVRDYGRLEHIITAIGLIEEFTSGITANDFKQNSMIYFAVVKNIEIIGEAVYMLSSDFKEQHPATPWNIITKMRHVMVHGYYQVDARQVWAMVTEDLQPLKAQISQYIAEYERD